jgi:hypothetical protein
MLSASRVEEVSAMRRLLVPVLFLIAALAAAGSVDAQPAPPNLAVPGGHFTAFQLMAEGVQIYACQARPDDPSAFEWAFRAPEATLMNMSGEIVGTHYVGPTWEGLDGSKVVGAARANADSPDPAAIPWLLLEVQSSAGTGVFTTVSYIQRLDTVGGRAPADGCGPAALGQEARVPYTAIYTFSYSAAAQE